MTQSPRFNDNSKVTYPRSSMNSRQRNNENYTKICRNLFKAGETAINTAGGRGRCEQTSKAQGSGSCLVRNDLREKMEARPPGQKGTAGDQGARAAGAPAQAAGNTQRCGHSGARSSNFL